MNFLFNINVCRVCMQNNQSNDLWSDKSLLEKYEFTTHLAISDKDDLPKSICIKCTTRLKIAYTFIKTAHESENNLKLFLAKINTEFKEVSQGNKSVNKELDDQSLNEDEFLSLMDVEDHENIGKDANLREKRNVSSSAECNSKKYKDKPEDDNKKISDNALKPTEQEDEGEIEIEVDNFKKDESVYRLSKDILLVNGSRDEIDSELENNTHFMEIRTQDVEGETDTRQFNDEIQVDMLRHDNTGADVNALALDEDSESQARSSELGVGDSEENQDYETMIGSHVESLQFQSIYINESSIDDVNTKVDTYYISNINEEVNNVTQDNSPSETTIGEDQKELVATLAHREENYLHRFYCEKCNRDFSTKTNLNRHMQSHEGNKPFTCKECKKRFTQKSTLKQHMYTHTGERPYVCEVCNRGFTQCKSLIFHMRRHTGEKPFHCEYCLITFRQKDALRIHILKHHVIIEQTSDGVDIFICIICQRKFDTKVDFKTHMKIHTAATEVDNVMDLIEHGQEETTVKKTKRFGTPDLLIPIGSESLNAAIVNVSASSAAEPSRAKKFQCRKCFKCFALKKSLIRHMRIHFINNEDELTECLDCDLQFSSSKIYQEHLAEYHQYACSGCPELIFKTVEDLKVHMFEHEFDQQG